MVVAGLVAPFEALRAGWFLDLLVEGRGGRGRGC